MKFVVSYVVIRKATMVIKRSGPFLLGKAILGLCVVCAVPQQPHARPMAPLHRFEQTRADRGAIMVSIDDKNRAQEPVFECVTGLKDSEIRRQVKDILLSCNEQDRVKPESFLYELQRDGKLRPLRADLLAIEQTRGSKRDSGPEFTQQLFDYFELPSRAGLLSLLHIPIQTLEGKSERRLSELASQRVRPALQRAMKVIGVSATA